ncbi:hypothetical protein JQX13_46265 [Archangium violaceum]|uniref:hypothetical protein n=1 Tax=Archangium violaceum TaxID=83451 RepID=UPI00193BAC24|nr:hypothetical protein [Archangium violaceum]QRK07360.1 hypothetical protein JQX13_46265 [Archangium violaceum]
MSWVLQAAVVLAIPLSLLGAVEAGVYLHRKAREFRRASVATAVDLQLGGMAGISAFRGWLADLVDGTSSDGDSSGLDASSGGDADASDAGGD